jgi:phytoene/squalene synthetase
MRDLFDKVSVKTSKLTTKTYSTSFSLGIHCLSKRLHDPIYSIYGFVRFADEIVDTFHEHDKETLLAEYRRDTYLAIERKISMNPILNSFQKVVNEFNIDHDLIDCFLKSMEMDLDQNKHNQTSYEQYILGSAEVVGLMCLHVFTEGDKELYLKLKPSAMRLGSAFQKVNFLRDLNDDYFQLGRVYFPTLKMNSFDEETKIEIEKDIQLDFDAALIGIKQLPSSSLFGVYVAYVYYRSLFNKIKSVPSKQILNQRIRIPNYQKASLLISSYFKMSFNLL